MTQDEKIKLIWAETQKFYDKLDGWLDKEYLKELGRTLSFQDYRKEYDLLKNAAVKKHISSTHTWIKGKTHRYKDNFYQSPLECKICGMGATDYEEVGFELVQVIDLPSRDMHNCAIHRTCEEVLAAKKQSRRLHKGGKCIQCWTYGCLLK